MECVKCKNTMGFVFGKCTKCGWNYLSNKWDTIKVNVNDLPRNIRYDLIEKHEQYYDQLRKLL